VREELAFILIGYGCSFRQLLQMTVLVGGMCELNANFGQSRPGVFADRPGSLTNDYFVNLLDAKSSDHDAAYSRSGWISFLSAGRPRGRWLPIAGRRLRQSPPARPAPPSTRIAPRTP
jgi:hypothetical protein